MQAVAAVGHGQEHNDMDHKSNGTKLSKRQGGSDANGKIEWALPDRMDSDQVSIDQLTWYL